MSVPIAKIVVDTLAQKDQRIAELEVYLRIG